MRSIGTLILFAAIAASCTSAPSAKADTDGGIVTGESLFNTNCALCHGRKGDLMMSGAKDLTKSTITREQAIAVVTDGRIGMMPYKNVLKPAEIEAVVDHALSLRVAK